MHRIKLLSVKGGKQSTFFFLSLFTKRNKMASQVNTPKPNALKMLDQALRADHEQQRKIEQENLARTKAEIERKKQMELFEQVAKKEKDSKIKKTLPNQFNTPYMATLTQEWITLMQHVLTYVQEETMAEHTDAYRQIVLSDLRKFSFPDQNIQGISEEHAKKIREEGFVPVAHQTRAAEILKWEAERASGSNDRMYSRNNDGKVYMSVAHPGKKFTFKYNSMPHTYDMGNRVPFISFETLKLWKNAQQYKRYDDLQASDVGGSDTDSMGSDVGLALLNEIDDALQRMHVPKIKTHEQKIEKQIYKLATITPEEMLKRKNKKLALLEPERMFVLDGGVCNPGKFSKEARDYLFDPRAKSKEYKEHLVPIKKDGSSFCVAPYTTTGYNGNQRNLAEHYHPDKYHHMGDVAKAYKQQEKGKGKGDIQQVTMAAAYDDMAFCASGSGNDNNECASDEKYKSPLGLDDKSRNSSCQKDNGGICKPYWMNTKESPLYQLYHKNGGEFVKTEISLGKKALAESKRKAHMDFSSPEEEKKKSSRWSASISTASKDASAEALSKLVGSLKLGGGENKEKPMIRRR